MTTHPRSLSGPVSGARGRLDALVIAFGDIVHARGDAQAHASGLSVTRVGRAGRAYRDPRFDELSARRGRRAASSKTDFPGPAA
jgi:hypothetical protein